MNSIKWLFLISIAVVISHGDYYLKPDKRAPSKIDNLPNNSVADMRDIPQDPSYYAPQIIPFSKERQKQLDTNYNDRYFAPWKWQRLEISPENLGWETRFVRKKPIYTIFGKEIPKKTYEKWITNAQMDQYDTIKAKAITIRRTDLKAFPIQESFYRDPRQTGEGFPFDYNQNSAYPINMPLYISHFSKDKKWAFVHGAYAFGWLPMEDIAFVDEKFQRTFQNGSYAIAIRDNLRLFESKKSISLVKLGTLFPYTKEGYLFGTKQSNGYAKVRYAKSTDGEIMAAKPLPFTPKNVGKIAKEFYGEPYGWGECYETRDCSATTRDFFAPFGIFLDRNSREQAKNGTYIPIGHLSPEAKKQAILKHALPFRSMLYVPGHIVLYLGSYNNEPVIMHTYWGVRQYDFSKLITARTIITTTEPGKELPQTRPESQLLNTLQGIISF
ncbi:MAG TPA: glycoside hydrolase [Epsilonproteobacteria bacterium]|nr:glycoside hydrolase [Campylobacterota bacterium]